MTIARGGWRSRLRVSLKRSVQPRCRAVFLVKFVFWDIFTPYKSAWYKVPSCDFVASAGGNVSCDLIAYMWVCSMLQGSKSLCTNSSESIQQKMLTKHWISGDVVTVECEWSAIGDAGDSSNEIVLGGVHHAWQDQDSWARSFHAAGLSMLQLESHLDWLAGVANPSVGQASTDEVDWTWVLFLHC